MFIYPYKVGSNSVKALKTALGAKIIKLENSNFKGSEDKLVINWGNSTPNQQVEGCLVLNSPEKIAAVSNKKTFFEMVDGQVRIPEYTTDIEVARKWCDEGTPVVIRTKLQGHSGEGIIMIETPSDFEVAPHQQAKLYVKYISKKAEYRVHVVGGKPILVQRKAKRSDMPNEMVNWRVRSHANGFVFVKNDGQPAPDDVIKQALLAVEAADLDFGAVDVVWNQFRKQASVLEINSAPGLEGTTVDTYVDALKYYTELLRDLTDEEPQPMSRHKKARSLFGTDAAIVEHYHAMLAQAPQPDVQPHPVHEDDLEEY